MKIAITGPESSGKTTLALALAKHYNCAYITEYARTYLEEQNRPYDKNDLDLIAKGQLTLEQKYSDNEWVICDTDMLTLNIWSIDKFGQVSDFIQKALKESHYDITFLMTPDFPWVYDPLRENEHDRDRLFKIYLDALKESESKYKVLEGSNENRLTKAINEIEALILQAE